MSGLIFYMILIGSIGFDEGRAAGSSSALRYSICLKNDNTDNEFRLSCKISELNDSVSFFAPSGELYGLCTESVYGERTNCSSHVTQDKISNVTMLTLYNLFDVGIFGQWKCVYGRNKMFDTTRIKPIPLVQTRSDSDIMGLSDLYGEAFYFEKRFFFKFTCKLTESPLDNSLVILINERTVDILRFENNECYNTKGKCTHDSCSCDINSNTFGWFYSTFSIIGSRKFEVHARFTNETSRTIEKHSLSRTFDGKDFGVLQIQIETIRPGIKESEFLRNKLTGFDNGINSILSVVPDLELSFLVAFFICAYVSIILLESKKKDKERRSINGLDMSCG